MFQYMMLNGESLKRPVRVPDLLMDILGGATPPKGLIGLDTETGLVKVQLSENKTTHMKLGRLMHKNGVSGDYCRDYSSKLRAIIQEMKGATLQLTKDGEEAYEVYKDGPHSCMQGMDCVKAYATEDVAVAFVKIDDRIVARSVVCKNEDIGLQYICIYGNKDLLKSLLEKAGYESGTLDGCCLDKLEDSDGNVMCPYLDCGTNIDVRGDYLEVTCSGDFSSQGTDGVLGERCEACGSVVSEDCTRYDEHTERSICESCFDECHVLVDGTHYHEDSSDIKMTGDNDYIKADEATYVDSENEYYHQDDCTYSEYSEEHYKTNDTITAITNLDYPDGEVCCKDDCTCVDNQWVHDDILEEYEESLNTQIDLDLEEE